MAVWSKRFQCCARFSYAHSRRTRSVLSSSSTSAIGLQFCFFRNLCVSMQPGSSLVAVVGALISIFINTPSVLQWARQAAPDQGGPAPAAPEPCLCPAPAVPPARAPCPGLPWWTAGDVLGGWLLVLFLVAGLILGFFARGWASRSAVAPTPTAAEPKRAAFLPGRRVTVQLR